MEIHEYTVSGWFLLNFGVGTLYALSRKFRLFATQLMGEPEDKLEPEFYILIFLGVVIGGVAVWGLTALLIYLTSPEASIMWLVCTGGTLVTLAAWGLGVMAENRRKALHDLAEVDL